MKVVLGHDIGMRVASVEFIVKPYSYRGGDDGLAGAVWHDTAAQDVPADGQKLTATFRGEDTSGRILPKGVYKVMVDLTGHRTSMSTCASHGPVDPYLTGPGGTGTIFGLASVAGAPRPRGA